MEPFQKKLDPHESGNMIFWIHQTLKFFLGENKNGRNHPTPRLLMVKENNKDIYMQWQYWYISNKNATTKKKQDSQNSISIFLLFFM